MTVAQPIPKGAFETFVFGTHVSFVTHSFADFRQKPRCCRSEASTPASSCSQQSSLGTRTLASLASPDGARLLAGAGRLCAGRIPLEARDTRARVHDGLSTRSARDWDHSRAGRVWRSRRGQAAVASHLTQLYHGLEVRQNGQGPIDDRPRRLLARTRPNRQGLTAVLDGRALRPQQRRPHAAQGLQGQR